jgi:hypothetical protein
MDGQTLVDENRIVNAIHGRSLTLATGIKTSALKLVCAVQPSFSATLAARSSF